MEERSDPHSTWEASTRQYSPIALVGGEGYLGSHICRILERERLQYWVVGKNAAYDGTSPYRSSSPDLREAIDGAKTVVHLATLTTPAIGEKNPLLDMENIRFTLDLIEAGNAVGIRKIVFSSSGGTIYGDTGGSPASEESEPRPSCSYAIAKLASEHYLRLAALHKDISSVVLRVGNLYGGDQRVKGEQGVIGYLLRKITACEKVILYGNTIRDYVHIDDVCRAFSLSIFRNMQGQEIFNISTARGTSLSDLVAMISRLCGHEALFRTISRRPFDLQSSILANEKARKILGWAPSISLEEGLARCLESVNAAIGE